MFVTGTVDKTHLFVMSENDVELLTNVFPWGPVELAKQYLILLLKTKKLLGKDLLADFEIELESELEDLEIKGCSVPFNFRKLLSREEILSAIILYYVKIFLLACLVFIIQ